VVFSFDVYARKKTSPHADAEETMRKLKLQMQMSVDGFVAGPDGQLDWMTWNHSDKLIALINHLTDTSDTILLGRKMTPGFVSYWEGVKPESPEYEFAKKMVGTPKVVFSRTIKQIEGRNLRVENGPIVDAVNRLKNQSGKDIVVYGGASFVSSLIEHRLIDELHLFVNPMAIGAGLRIFSQRTALTLQQSMAYPCGIVVNTYARQ
jgi:dihydrofolate reductase